MNRQERYRDLMERILLAHSEFKREWQRVRDAELHKRGVVLPSSGWPDHNDLEQLWKANGVAYNAAKPQAGYRDELLGSLFDTIPRDKFLAGEPEAINVIIDFLEVDIPAFRCGYAKVWYLRRLKSLPLLPSHTKRLRILLVTWCSSVIGRQEFRELIRLMIKHADDALVQDLVHLTTQHSKEGTQRRARQAVSIILNSRPELKVAT